MAKKPTFRDIAEHADVALSTVSQVLNNKPNVSAEMRQRVLTAADELGYRQKVEVNRPDKSKLSTVGLLTKSRHNDILIVNPFYSYVIAGAERECQRHNINLMYANIEVDENNNALNWPAMLLDEIVDGMIVVGTFLQETIADISRRAGRNIVLVDAYTSNEAAFDSVLIDNFGGAFNAVSHLIANGHQHIGLVGSHKGTYPSIAERRKGYVAAMIDAGFEQTYIEESTLDRADGFQATIRLLRRHPEITAIFACNDNCAIGVMNAVREMGLDIPGDVSVAGFDDIDLAQEVTPSLTTIHVDKVLMGALALRHLRDRVEDPDHAALKTLVSTLLIERESVRSIQIED